MKEISEKAVELLLKRSSNVRRWSHSSEIRRRETRARLGRNKVSVSRKKRWTFKPRQGLYCWASYRQDSISPSCMGRTFNWTFPFSRKRKHFATCRWETLCQTMTNLVTIFKLNETPSQTNLSDGRSLDSHPTPKEKEMDKLEFEQWRHSTTT